MRGRNDMYKDEDYHGMVCKEIVHTEFESIATFGDEKSGTVITWTIAGVSNFVDMIPGVKYDIYMKWIQLSD